MAAQEDALKPLIDLEVSARANAAAEDGTAQDTADLRKLLSTAVGSALFEEEALQLSFRDFLERGSAAVRSVEEHAFDPVEVGSFYTMMGTESNLLLRGGSRHTHSHGFR